MKKLTLSLLIMLVAMPAIILSSCGDDDTISAETYREWIKENNDWITALETKTDENGDLVYSKVIPDYDKGVYILMRWFNDRAETKDNLVPYWTSTVDVKYYGELCDGTPVDSSYLSVSPADSIYRTRLNSVIEGWGIALQQMHVGDTCEVIIPFMSAYGVSGSSSIPPYSNLKFGIKLVDIPYYEVKQ